MGVMMLNLEPECWVAGISTWGNGSKWVCSRNSVWLKTSIHYVK